MAAAALSQLNTSPPSSLARKADGAQRRILYAEDQVSSRVVTKAMLERMGFFVDAVDDGEVAVELARQSQYDMILLDIEMPIMDGVTAARMIRTEIAGFKNTPILALSAFLADSTEHTHWRDAFDSAVPKPANSNELQRAMVRAMAKHEVESKTETFDRQAGVVSAKASVWSAMKEGMPTGMTRLLAMTAAGEMQHLALALAASREANDMEALHKYRHALKGLALNFGLDNVNTMIVETTAEPANINIAGIFTAIVIWRDANALP